MSKDLVSFVLKERGIQDISRLETVKIDLLEELTANLSDPYYTCSHPKFDSVLPKATLFKGNRKEVVLVNQGECSITKADNRKPILATYGISSCIGVIGWSENQGVGFLSHYDGLDNAGFSFNPLLRKLARFKKNNEIDFYVRLLGGVKGLSEDLVYLIKSEFINKRNDYGITFNLVEQKTCRLLLSQVIDRSQDINLQDGSAAIDVRSGKFYTYMPSCEEMVKHDFAQKSNSRSKLAYFPRK